VFVANFDLFGNLKYSAVIGAEATDVTNGVAVDSSGAVYLTGYTSSTDFPTAGSPPYQATPGPGTDGGPTSQEDAFIAKISPAATTTMSSLTNPSTAGQNVTFNITVSIGGSPATDGVVRVYDNLSFIRDFVLSRHKLDSCSPSSTLRRRWASTRSSPITNPQWPVRWTSTAWRA
jgi:hypothetical protein